MDVIAMKNPLATMRMQQGEIINGMTSKMWVERYADAGEFRFVAPVSSGIRAKLPIGSFVSHINTQELMIVENHEIADNQDEESEITVTGRGFETYFEQRIVGSNRSFPRLLSDGGGKFLLPEQHVWDQVVHLINQHLSAGYLADDNSALNYLVVNTIVAGAGVVVSRKVELRDLYSAALDLMKVANLGIRVIRPGFRSPLGPTSPNTLIRVHRGANRTENVVFSYDSGQIVHADYLWSHKDVKTSAVVSSKWLQTIVHLPGKTNYDRRMMQVDATDIDEDLDEGTAIFVMSLLVDRLAERGREALKAQKEVILTKAEVSKKTVESRYRVDFNVGDLITVVGDYNENSVMRVSEFVEIEDENGTVAYPTLSLEQDS